MFKFGSFENELFEGMQAAENAASVKEEVQDMALVFAAMEELNQAAELFESVGLTERAKEVTSLIGDIVNNGDF